MQFSAAGWFDASDRPDHPTYTNTRVDDFQVDLVNQIQHYFEKPKEDAADLVNIDVRVDESRFKYLQGMADDVACCNVFTPQGTPENPPRSKRCFLTFHGTNCPGALDSIARFGFLAPGEQHPRYGYHLNMSTGNMYGDGVYSSSLASFAANYAYRGPNGTRRLVVSVLFCGNIALFGRGRTGVLGRERAIGKPSRSARHSAREDGVRQLVGDEFGVYRTAEYANTITPDYSTMWIAARSSAIVPVAIVTVRLRSAFGSSAGAIPLAALTLPRDAPLPPSALATSVESSSAIVLTHLFDDYYALPKGLFAAAVGAQHVVRHILVPRASLFDKSMRTALAHYTQGKCVKGRDSVVFFGSRGVSRRVDADAFGGAAAAEAVREPGPPKYEAALEALFTELTTASGSQRSEQARLDSYHVVCIVVDASTRGDFSENTVAELERAWGPSLRRLYLNIKIIATYALGASSPSGMEKLKPFLKLKSVFQWEGIFESLIHDGAKRKWPEIWDDVEDEMQNVLSSSKAAYIGDFVPSRGKLKLAASRYRHIGEAGGDYDSDGMERTNLGEGFVTALDREPVPAGAFDHMVLWKGAPPHSIAVDDAPEKRVIVATWYHRSSAETVRDAKAATGAAGDVSAGSEDDEAMALQTVGLPSVGTKEGSEAKWAAQRLRTRVSRLYLSTVTAPNEQSESGSESAIQRVSSSRHPGVYSLATRQQQFACGVLLTFLSRFRNTAVVDKGTLSMHRGVVYRVATGIQKIAANPQTSVVVGRQLMGAVASILAELNAFCAAPFSGAWFAAFQRMRFGAKVLKRAADSAELRRAMAQDQRAVVSVLEASGSLPDEAELQGRLETYSEARGRPVRILRSSASDIEPWLLVVDYVNVQEELTASSMFRSGEIEEDIVDGSGEGITDVVLWPPTEEEAPQRRRLLDVAYTAYVFTRNPYLAVPGQAIALQTVAWVKVVETILLRCRPLSQAATGSALPQAATVQCHVRQALDWTRRLAPFFTTECARQGGDTGGAPLDLSVVANKSMCQLLGRCIPFYLEPRRTHAAPNSVPIRTRFDVLAESICRLVHSFARATRRTQTDDLLDWMLGFPRDAAADDDPSLLERFSIDIERTCRRTGKLLFHYAYNNCSPFAVVAVFGFLRTLGQATADGVDATDAIAAAFASREVSMRELLAEWASLTPSTDGRAHAWDPKLTQVALFVFAAQHHDAATERRFTDRLEATGPEAFLAAALDGRKKRALQSIEAKRRDAARRGDRVQRRWARRAEHVEACRRAHRTPRLFTKEDVDDMNSRRMYRPAATGGEEVENVPFEWQPSGLLKHHCCYPDCPEYLACFATRADITLNLRHGMMRHLRYNAAANNYVPRIHLTAKRLGRGSSTFEEFVARMDVEFASCGEYAKLADRAVQLRAMFEFYRAH